jgi:hypothetical protein
MRRGAGFWVALAVVGVVVSGVSWGANRLLSTLSCAWDTSVCGERASARTDFRGRLFDHRGRPAPGVELEFRNELYGTDFGLEVVTDEEGRFCVRAATYSSYAGVVGQEHISRHVVRSSAPVDARFEDPDVLARLRSEQSRDPTAEGNYFGFMAVGRGDLSPTGAYTAFDTWDPSVDATDTCQDPGRGPIWHRFEDVTSTWQYRVLDVVFYVIAGLFVLAVLWWGKARESERGGAMATWPFRVMVAAAAVHLLLVIVLWFG